ncbi:hypothetical protein CAUPRSCDRAFT_10803 [Caulochytrium protostelioides]|uniref:Clathrin/coatomer adaptor adaptin-like N-terminal domain-containing protein n=1 Tax=Caulochytrium protostelioides TaxID=1555241 RepID=A0A4P9X0Q2_9FUNG|nr:hypothetical protein CAUPRSCDRAFT_10803 [Caulochytrium protostelioides]
MDHYLQRAGQLASQATRLSKRLTSEILERSRDSGLPVVSAVVGARLDDTSDDRLHEIRQQLNNRFERDKLDGMRRLIALIAKGRDVSDFFPDVVKNVASSSFELRKLVYIYLLRYADAEPDLALLSINSFQRDIADRNPVIRAMALRVMSSIRVPVIAPLMTVALRKAVTDLSPYVRRTAATAIAKCYALDPACRDELMDCLRTLLTDASTLVVGHAVTTYRQIMADSEIVSKDDTNDNDDETSESRFNDDGEPHADMDAMLHPVYRRLCAILIDADEWSQIDMMQLLMRYARRCFTEDDAHATPEARPTTLDEAPPATSSAAARAADLRLFIDACYPFVLARNPSVVLTAMAVFDSLGTNADRAHIVPALVRLLYTDTATKRLVLDAILRIAEHHPQLVTPYMRHFTVYESDPLPIRERLLEIVVHAADTAAAATAVRELRWTIQRISLPADALGTGSGTRSLATTATPGASTPRLDVAAASTPAWDASHGAHDDDIAVLAMTLRAMGRLAMRHPAHQRSCLRTLLDVLARHGRASPPIAAEAVTAIRLLVQTAPTHERMAVVRRLVASFQQTEGESKAVILWLVGQYVCEAGTDDAAPPPSAHSAPPSLSNVNAASTTTAAEAADHALGLAAEVLRLALTTFIDEAVAVRYQIINLAVKVWAAVADLENTGTEPSPRGGSVSPELTRQIQLMAQYALALASRDACWDLRDRARFLQTAAGLPRFTATVSAADAAAAATGASSSTVAPDGAANLARRTRAALRAAKPIAMPDLLFRAHARYAPTTLSHVLGQPAAGYVPLPEWAAGDAGRRHAEAAHLARQAADTAAARHQAGSAASQGPALTGFGNTAFLPGASAGPSSSSAALQNRSMLGPASGSAASATPPVRRVIDLDSFYREDSDSDSDSGSDSDSDDGDGNAAEAVEEDDESGTDDDSADDA